MKMDFYIQLNNHQLILNNIRKRIIFNDENSKNPHDEIKVIFNNEINRETKNYFAYLSNEDKESKNLIIFIKDNITENFKENDIVEFININGKLFIKKIFRSDSNDNILFLTNKCNSNCKFCPDSEEVRKNKKEYIEENIELLNLLPENIKHIGITGGEPTITKDGFLKILNKCKEKFPNIDYTVISNGRMFYYKDFCDKYKENRPIKTKVAIAIHGYNAKTHDIITQVNGSFYQTSAGIKNLLSLNERIELRIVLNKMNFQILDKIAEMIVRNFYGIEEVNILSLELLGNAGKNYNNFWIEKDEINFALEKALPIFMLNKIKVNLYNFPLCFLKSKFWNISKKSITDYKSKYGEECNRCKVKNKCDGFFFSTYNIIQPKLNPVE